MTLTIKNEDMINTEMDMVFGDFEMEDLIAILEEYSMEPVTHIEARPSLIMVTTIK